MRAFTLMELVVVLSTIAVLAAVAVPRYQRSVTRYRIQLASQRLARDIDWVRFQARAQSTSYTFTVNKTAETWTLGPTETPIGTRVVDITDDPYRCQVGSTNLVTSKVTFDAWGMPDQIGNRVRLINGHWRQDVTIGVTTVVTDPEPL